MEVLLRIKDNKAQEFFDYIKNLRYVEVMDEPETPKEEVLQRLRDALEEVKKIERGELKPLTFEEMMDEL